VESGPEGFANFLARVRGLFGIDTQQQMDLTFDCAEPATGTCRLSLVVVFLLCCHFMNWSMVAAG